MSLVNHSCVPNLSHTNLLSRLASRGENRYGVLCCTSVLHRPALCSPGGEIAVMQLEAGRAVLPGTELSIRYTDYTLSHTQVFSAPPIS